MTGTTACLIKRQYAPSIDNRNLVALFCTLTLFKEGGMVIAPKNEFFCTLTAQKRVVRL